MRRFAAATLACALLGCPQTAAAQDSSAPLRPAPVLNDDQLFRKYVMSSVGPPGMLGAAAAAGFEHWQNYPDEWRQGLSGYMKRWASAYAAGAIGDSTKYAIAHFQHEDPSFARCTCRGFKARMRHAAVSAFTARTRDGRTVFSLATVAGYSAEHVVPAVLWFPPRERWTEGVGLVGASIGSKIAVNIFHEFVGRPRIVIRRN